MDEHTEQDVECGKGTDRRRERTAMVALGGVVMLPMLNVTSVATALPAMGSDLGHFDQISTVVTAYLVASIVAIPLVGKLGDQFGRRPVILAGISMFLLGSVACATSQTFAQIIVARVAQGLGGGSLVVLAQAAIADVAPRARRPAYHGYLGAVMALTSAIGPVVGGVVVDHLSWRWIFAANLPAGLVIAALVQRALPHRRQTLGRQFDVAGMVLLTISLSALLLAANRLSRPDPEWTLANLALVGTASAGASLLWITEARAPAPVVPTRLLAGTTYRRLCAIGFITHAAFQGSIVFGSVYLQSVAGISATGAGIAFVPYMLAFLLTTTVSGRMLTRSDRFIGFPIAGTLLIAAGCALIGLRAAPSTPALWTCICLTVVGLGGGFVNQVLVVAAQNTVSAGEMGVATSTIQFSRQLGATLGITGLGAILSVRLSSAGERLSGLVDGVDLQSVVRDPSRLADLDRSTRAVVRSDLADTLGAIFLVAAALATIGCVLGCALARHQVARPTR